MGWSRWGLAPLTESAPDRAVLATGRRFLIRGADEFQAWIIEELDARWVVTSVLITDTEPRPRRNDILVFRGEPREDPGNFGLWGAPTRVLGVGLAEVDGMLEVTCLEDSSLHERTSVSDGILAAIAVDDVFDEARAWSLLAAAWGLNPKCLRCGSNGVPIAYGLVGPRTGDDDYVIGGCVVTADDPHFACRRCGDHFLRPARLIGER